MMRTPDIALECFRALFMPSLLSQPNIIRIGICTTYGDNYCVSVSMPQGRYHFYRYIPVEEVVRKMSVFSEVSGGWDILTRRLMEPNAVNNFWTSLVCGSVL